MKLLLLLLLLVGCSANQELPTDNTSVTTESAADIIYYDISASKSMSMPPSNPVISPKTKPKTIKKLASMATPEAVVDDVLAQLSNASMSFIVPNSANITDHITLQLLIDPSATISELEKKLTESGTISSANITISKIVSADLVASEFTIQPLTPLKQAIAQTAPTEWIWILTPIRAGKQKIHLSINAIVTVQGTSVERSIKTFDQIITIDISTPQIVKTWFEKYWQWVWSAITIPILGLLWRRYKKS